MILVFGTSPRTQRAGTTNLHCPSCRIDTESEVTRYYRVAHVFFIPMFTTQSVVEVVCSTCGQARAYVPPKPAALGHPHRASGDRPEPIATSFVLPSIPWMDRFGFVLPIAGAFAVGVAGAVQFVARQAEKDRAPVAYTEENAKHRKRLENGTRVLAERLAQEEQQTALGSVTGKDQEAAAITQRAMAVLPKTLGLKKEAIGARGVVVIFENGKHFLLITRIANEAELRLDKVTEALKATADEMSKQLDLGTPVTWAILHRGVYVTASGSMGGQWFLQKDPLKARKVAEEAMNFSEIRRAE